MDETLFGERIECEEEEAYWEPAYCHRDRIEGWLDVAADRQLLQRCLDLIEKGR